MSTNYSDINQQMVKVYMDHMRGGIHSYRRYITYDYDHTNPHKSTIIIFYSTNDTRTNYVSVSCDMIVKFWKELNYENQ